MGTASAERSESKSYIGVTGDLTVLSCSRTVGDRTVGGACFDLQPDDRSVSVRVEDERGAEVGAQLMFWSADGERMMSQYWSFCATSGSLPVPAGAVRLVVYVSTVFAVYDCDDASKFATVGTITARFS